MLNYRWLINLCDVKLQIRSFIQCIFIIYLSHIYHIFIIYMSDVAELLPYGQLGYVSIFAGALLIAGIGFRNRIYIVLDRITKNMWSASNLKKHNSVPDMMNRVSDLNDISSFYQLHLCPYMNG